MAGSELSPTAGAALLTATGRGGVAGWVGVEVKAAVDVGQGREYSNLSEVERYDKATQAERLWLTGLWNRQRTAWNLRWITDGNSLRVFIIAAISAASTNELERAGKSALGLLKSAPDHVVVEPISDDETLNWVLAPFDPPVGGVAQVLKRCVVGTPNRADERQPEYYFAIQPFQSSPQLWPPLVSSLSRSPQPVCLSISLSPTETDPRLADVLTRVGSQYQRLAESAPQRGPALYSASLDEGPEAFALDAKDLYMDAARRYRANTFTTHIGVYSPADLDEGMLNSIAAVIGGSERSGTEDSVTSEFRGSAATVERPRDEDDHRTAIHNLQTLDTRSWGGDRIWEHERPPPQLLRQVTYLVDTEEALAAFRLPFAVNGRLPGFPVRAPILDLGTVSDVTGPAFTLGRQITGGQPGEPALVSLNELRTHALYIGATGSGKSTSVQSLLRQVYSDHGLAFMVIEPVNTTRNDYRRFLTTAGFEDTLILTAGSETIAPLRLNPFQVPDGVTVGEHSSSILSAFDAAFGLWDPLPALYREALTKTYAEAGYSSASQGGDDLSWPTIAEFQRELATVVKDQNYQGEVASNIEAASLVRVRQLATGPVGSVLNCRKSFPFHLLMDKPLVVELAHLGVAAIQDQALVIALLLTTMTETIGRDDREANSLHHLTVIEEAHRLLKQAEPTGEQGGDSAAAASLLFSNLLAEVRKHGESLVIVDQDPAKLIPDTYKNTNLKVMHRLPYGPDREMLGSAMTFDDDHTRAAANLNTFTAIAHTAEMDRPTHLLTDGHDLVEQQQLGPIATNTQVHERFERFRAEYPEVQDAMRPYLACQTCQSVCQHRDSSTAIAQTSAARRIYIKANHQQPNPAEGTDHGENHRDKPQRAETWDQWHHKLYEALDQHLTKLDQPNTHDANACLMMHLAQRVHPTHNTTNLATNYRNTTQPKPPPP